MDMPLLAVSFNHINFQTKFHLTFVYTEINDDILTIRCSLLILNFSQNYRFETAYLGA